MKINYIKDLIDSGEGINIEFKESKTKLNKDVFESVCAFLNRIEGHLFLGVKDNGTIVGVDETSIEKIKNDFITSMNNPMKINPTFYLSIEEIEIDNMKILYVFIPKSSQVHRCNGKIFDRNEDGDIDITNNTNLVAGLYLKKQSSYTENRIFPYVEMEYLELDLFTRVRKLAENQKSNHPWSSMNNLELLKSSGLYLIEPNTGKEGITLGGILIFGKEQLIQAALPHHKTDAILRRENLDRYDDRDDVRVNLIHSYERLIQFVRKHLNDKFYLEGDQRVSLRDKIFREIGWVDELGSGVRNIYKYNKIYSGAEPVFIEEDVFKTIIPLAPDGSDQATVQVTNQATNQADEEIVKILEFCKVSRSRKEIQEFMNLSNRGYFRTNILNPLIKGGLLKLTIPEKPTSPKQKYYSENR